jgi:hypothetical protein
MANQIPVSEASTGRVVKDSDNGEVKVFIESQKEVAKGVEKEESEFDKPLKFMGLKKVFNLDPLSVETDKELSYIENYGKERGLSNVKLAAKIKEVEAKLGYLPKSGKEKLKHVYRYLKIESQFRSSALELSKLEK